MRNNTFEPKLLQLYFIGAIILTLTIAFSLTSGEITGLFSQSAEKTIKIGVILPLTGFAANYGTPIGNAITLATEELNSKGGINGKKIELLVEDGKCDAKEATNAANKLINLEQVKIIFTGCSSESLVVAPIANQNKIIQMAVVTSASNYSTAGEYSFRTFPPAAYYVGKEALWARSAKNSKKIALLYEQKEFPTSTAEAFKTEFIKNGGNVVSEQTFPENETNFRNYLGKINASKADSIFIAGTGEVNLLPLIRQLYELGLNEKYIIYSNNVGATVKMNMVSNGLNKYIYSVDLYADQNTPKMSVFLENYSKRFKSNIDTTLYWVSSAYDATQLILNTMKTCDENTSCIKQELYKTTSYEGISGKIGFDSNGDALPPIAVHYWDENQNEHWESLGLVN